MLSQLKNYSLLLNIKRSISREQQSDETKTEQGFPETGWITSVFCFVLCLYFFLFLFPFPPRCAERSKRFHALHFARSYFDTAVGRAWQEKSQSLV